MSAVIVDAVRTCAGAQAGALSTWHAVDLFAYACDALRIRCGLHSSEIHFVVGASRTAVGEQALNIARNAVVAAGWPEHIPGVTLEGSRAVGVSAIEYAMGVVANRPDAIVIVGGVEMASRVPPGASTGIASGKPFGPKVHDRYLSDGGLVPPGMVAERMAARFGFGRQEMDSWTATSRDRAREAARAGRHKSSLLAVPVRPDRLSDADPALTEDELVHRDQNILELKPTFEVDGLVTAGNMAQPADAAAAVLITSKRHARARSLPVLADISGVALRGSRLVDGDSGADAALSALRARRLTSNVTVDVYEDFAASPLAFLATTDIDPGVLNADGGALAFGDVGGASVASMVAVVAGRVQATSTPALAVISGIDGLSGAVALRAPD